MCRKDTASTVFAAIAMLSVSRAVADAPGIERLMLETSLGAMDDGSFVLAGHLGVSSGRRWFVALGADLHESINKEYSRTRVGISTSLGVNRGNAMNDGDRLVGNRIYVRIGGFVGTTDNVEHWTSLGARLSLGFTSSAWSARTDLRPFAYFNHVELGMQREDFAARDVKLLVLVGFGM